VLLVLAVGAIFVLLGGPKSLRYRRHFDRLVQTNDHGVVARAAITVIRGATNQTLLTGNLLANLPPEITRMKPRYVSVSPEHMTIEFHGGFDHFGFKIEDRDQTWDMSWYTEKGRHPLLSIGKGERSVRPSQGMTREIILDMSTITSFEDFIEICNLGFIDSVGGKWNGSLDAFNDYLSWPEPNPYSLIIIGESNCRKVLGYKATAKRLSTILKTCHPSNREEIKKEYEDALKNKGKTLWDTIIEIFEDNKEWVNVTFK
jgi:hypothetical protein